MMDVTINDETAEMNTDEETLFMSESNLLPIPIHRGVYFYCDREGYVHGFCNINITDGTAAFGCWFGPYHCLNVGQLMLDRDSQTFENRSQLKAAIHLIKIIQKFGVKKLIIHTSCEYVSQCISKWLDLWQTTNWTTTRGSPVKNRDILEEFIKLKGSIDIKSFLHQNESRGITGAFELATAAHQQQSSNKTQQTPPRNMAINQPCPVQSYCPAGVSRALFTG